MKKRVKVFVIVLLIAVLSLIFSFIPSFIFALPSEVEDAYSCLEERVFGKCSNLPSQQQSFSLLALSYNSSLQEECRDVLEDNKDANDCWPKGSCSLKETSLAILALSELNIDTEDEEDWLLSQKSISDKLIWYLEIDSDDAVSCTITYDNTDYTINIAEDKKIDTGAGNCLALAVEYDNYWLEINTNCYEKNFTISCDKYFSSTLLYQKQGSSTIYVSSDTKSAPADATTKHIVKSYCLEIPCNYEGSLWATSVLAKNSRDYSVFLPYLMAFAEDNENLLPSAFLYMITDYSQYLTELTEARTVSGDYVFWKTGDDKFYDTALALYALKDTSSSDADKAKSYLLLDGIQDDDGCWKSIKDTAFILYAAWPKPYTPIEPECEDDEDCPEGYVCENERCVPECVPDCTDKKCGDDGCGGSCGNCSELYDISYYCNNYTCINETTECVDECTSGEKKCSGNYLYTCGNYNDDDCLEWGNKIKCVKGCDNQTNKCINQTTSGDGDSCIDAGYYCVSPLKCSEEDNLDYLGLVCSGIKVCCLSESSEQTCDDLDGIECSTNQECTGSMRSASDTSRCCVGGSCIERGEVEETACEKANYDCRFSCSEDEEGKDFSCDTGKKCCGPAEKEEKSYLWLWLLIILIILVVLAIIFRNQLKIWLFRIKSKFKKGPPPSRTGPGFFPPRRILPRARPRMILPRQPARRPIPKTARTEKNKELDETLKKLKQMGR